MEKLKELVQEIERANPVRKVMLAQEVLPLVCLHLEQDRNKLANLECRIAELEGKKNAKG